MFELFSKIFDTSDFPARWNCGEWTDIHGWTHIISDFAIAGAYGAIPVTIAYFLFRRRDVSFLPIFWLFAAFILFCGLGHFVEATIFWHPWYRVSAIVKVATAIVSWVTVLALLPILPRALSLPGLVYMNKQLEESNRDLQRFANAVTRREDRVIELKQEVNGLLTQLGREPVYLREDTVE